MTVGGWKSDVRQFESLMQTDSRLYLPPPTETETCFYASSYSGFYSISALWPFEPLHSQTKTINSEHCTSSQSMFINSRDPDDIRLQWVKHSHSPSCHEVKGYEHRAWQRHTSTKKRDCHSTLGNSNVSNLSHQIVRLLHMDNEIPFSIELQVHPSVSQDQISQLLVPENELSRQDI